MTSNGIVIASGEAARQSRVCVNRSGLLRSARNDEVGQSKVIRVERTSSQASLLLPQAGGGRFVQRRIWGEAGARRYNRKAFLRRAHGLRSDSSLRGLSRNSGVGNCCRFVAWQSQARPDAFFVCAPQHFDRHKACAEGPALTEAGRRAAGRDDPFNFRGSTHDKSLSRMRLHAPCPVRRAGHRFRPG